MFGAILNEVFCQRAAARSQLSARQSTPTYYYAFKAVSSWWRCPGHHVRLQYFQPPQALVISRNADSAARVTITVVTAAFSACRPAQPPLEISSNSLIGPPGALRPNVAVAREHQVDVLSFHDNYVGTSSRTHAELTGKHEPHAGGPQYLLGHVNLVV